MTLQEGALLNNRYRIRGELGSGGMGAVYRARDENLDVEAAVKENFFVSEESARQFEREARLLATLRHPNLPRVTDHFVIPDQGQYLVMDYVEGKDARQLLEEQGGPLPEASVLGWAKEILDALAYLHSHKPRPVIHRDIKPGNVKITPEGKAVLVDFGLAKEHDPGKSTTVGAKAFTPGFAPPEQYGQGRTDVRTDYYSLGATLYNLLTGKIPADGLQRAMGKERLIGVLDLNSEVSPQVAAAIERATAVRPEDRFASAKEFEASLYAAPTVAAPLPATVVRPPSGAPTVVAPAAPPVARPRRRWVLPAILGALVLLALGVGAGMLLPGAFSNFGVPAGEATSEATATAVPQDPTELPTAALEPSVTVPPPTAAPTDLPPTELSTPALTPTPATTPQGGGSGQIAFVSERFGLPQIFLMNADGSDLAQLTTLSDGACQPAWSPDGQTLLFVSPCREKRSSYPNAAIYSMNADGSDAQVLISRPGGVYDPDWSETGIAFTYLDNNIPAIWTANPSGSNQVKLSRGRARDSQAEWSPAGDKLAMMNTSRAGSPTIFWVFSDGSFNGSNPDQVTRDQVADSPAWSPDGNLIAYVVVTHIYVVPWDAVGFGTVKLTIQGPNDSPSWSPDGQWIAFETWRDAANHDIYIMTANGGQPTRLTDDLARDYHPAWRP